MASNQARWSKPQQRKSTWLHKPEKVAPPTPPPALGSLLKTLQQSDLVDTAERNTQAAVIRNCELVASYNWKDDVEPKIAIPGKPPRWTPMTYPTRLRLDTGTYYRDRNAAQFPEHPMEAAVVACLSVDPGVPSKVDVVACSSTLGNLLRFVRGETKTSRILVENVHGTVFLIRRENSPRETIPDVRGYGHTFPENYTTWEADVKGSLNHQRIIRYVFGGLDFLVRFEADGYIPGQAGTAPIDRKVSVSNVDQLSELLSGSTVAPTETAVGSRLSISSGGSIVNQSRIFDLKTRSQRKIEEDVLGGELPRMWVAQVPNFILAYHNNGVFKDIRVMDVRKDIEQWEEEHRQDLSRLAALIHNIVELASAREDGKLELCLLDTGTLEVRSQLADAGKTLSRETRERWLAGKRNVAGETDSSSGGGGAHGVDSDGEPYDDDLNWETGSAEDEEREELDYTACHADLCGYCGKCKY